MWRGRTVALLFLAMESLWFFVLSELLAATSHGSGPSVLALFAAALGGFWLVRLLEHVDLPRQRLVLLGTGVSLLGLWLLIWLQYGTLSQPLGLAGAGAAIGAPQRIFSGRAAPLVGSAVIGALWLRASLAGLQYRVAYRAVLRSFTIGLLVVVFGLLIGRAAVSSRAIDLAALPYFVVGLLALACAHLNQSEGAQGGAWRGPWLLVLAATAGFLALAGALIGLLPLGLLNAALAPVAELALLLIDALIYAIALPSAIVLNWLFGLLFGGKHKATQPQASSGAPTKLPKPPARAPGRAIVLITLIAKLLLALIVLAVILFAVYWVYRRLSARLPAGDTDEERESIWREGSLRADLGALLSALRRRRAGAPAVPEPPLPPRILALRRLYLGLLRRAEADGLPRPAAATPNEFAPLLGGRYASTAPEQVSAVFTAARYGLVEPAPDEVARLDRTLRDLRP